MTDNERAMYTGIAISRNTEVNLRWARSQLFIFVNFGGFSFLATQTPSRHLYILNLNRFENECAGLNLYNQ